MDNKSFQENLNAKNQKGGMMHLIRNSVLRCLSVAVLCAVGFPASADWQPTLATAEHADYRAGDEAFRIRVPAEVPAEELQKLALELDAIDVTAMVQRDGEYAVFTPIQALVPGRHVLRLVEYADDGSVLELGFWSFEVRQSKLFREYAVAADTQVTGSYRAADNSLNDPLPDRLQGQGSSRVGFSTASGVWHSQGQFDLIYNSLNNEQPDSRQFDSGEFLFSVGNTHADARVGHQTVGTTSLVMDNFRRRGVSLEGRIPVINSRLSGFSLSSEDVIGFRRGLGVGDDNRRVDGVTFDSNPLPDNPRALYLSGTWLDGKGRDSSGLVASVGDAEPGLSKGSAWSLSADSQLFGDHLRLRGEYADTDYDFNTADSLNSERDTAYSFLASFTDTTAAGLNWNASVESRKIGTFFKSLGNQALPSDRRLLRAFGGAQWSTLGVQASVEQQKDNVRDIEQLPRIQTDLSSVSVNWAPTTPSGNGWLGAPSLSAAYSRQTQDQTFTPVGFTQPQTNNDLDSWQTHGALGYPFGSLGLTLQSSQFRDHAGVQDDTDTTGIHFDSNVALMQQRINLTPSARFDRTDDKTTNQNSIAITYGLQTAFVLKPEKLDSTLNVSLNRNRSTDDSIASDTLTFDMALNWHLIAARRNRPGFDLGLSALYNDVQDKVVGSNTISTYQAFLTLTMILPARAGQAQ